MKIGIDCRTMLDPQNEKGGGIERYTFTLVTTLMESEHEFVLFLPKSYQSDSLFIEQKNVTIHYLQDGGFPFWNSHFGFAQKIDSHHLDLFYSPITSLPLGLKTKALVTVHDFSIYTHPEWFPGGQWFSKQVLVPGALRKAKKIVAVSKVSKDDCIDLFNIDEEKIVVVHNILPDRKLFFKQPTEKRKLPKRYILFIGTLEPRKNLERIFHVFLGLKQKEKFKNLSLVIMGSMGWRTEDVFGEYSKKELEKSDVVFLEKITEKEKWHIIDKSELLFFPSLYEGFGLPVLEALTAKKKVVTSREGALEEIGTDNATYVDPYDINEMIITLNFELDNEEMFYPSLEIFSSALYKKKMIGLFEELY